MSSKLKLTNENGKQLVIDSGSITEDKQIQASDIAYTRATIDDMMDIPNPSIGDVCVVTEDGRGGTFVFGTIDTDAKLTIGGDGGVNFTTDNVAYKGWKRQYSGAVNVEWFGVNETSTSGNNTVVLNRIFTYGYSIDGSNLTINIDNTLFLTSTNKVKNITINNSSSTYTFQITIVSYNKKNILSNITINGKNGIEFIGNGWDFGIYSCILNCSSTSLYLNPSSWFTNVNINNSTFIGSEYFIKQEKDCHTITFNNCYFQHISSSTSVLITVDEGFNITLNNCILWKDSLSNFSYLETSTSFTKDLILNISGGYYEIPCKLNTHIAISYAEFITFDKNSHKTNSILSSDKNLNNLVFLDFDNWQGSSYIAEANETYFGAQVYNITIPTNSNINIVYRYENINMQTKFNELRSLNFFKYEGNSSDLAGSKLYLEGQTSDGVYHNDGIFYFADNELLDFYSPKPVNNDLSQLDITTFNTLYLVYNLYNTTGSDIILKTILPNITTGLINSLIPVGKVKLEKALTSTFTGDGTTIQFDVTTGFNIACTYANVIAMNNKSKYSYITINQHSISIFFDTAPTSGDTLSFNCTFGF